MIDAFAPDVAVAWEASDRKTKKAVARYFAEDGVTLRAETFGEGQTSEMLPEVYPSRDTAMKDGGILMDRIKEIGVRHALVQRLPAIGPEIAEIFEHVNAHPIQPAAAEASHLLNVFLALSSQLAPIISSCLLAACSGINTQ